MKTDALDSIPMVARQAIKRAAEATGVDFSLLVETARRESSFNPSARAPTSSATGLFQFIETTWLETVRRHGAKHGLGVYASQIEFANGRPQVSDPQVRQQILDLRYDPELSARMGAELARENGDALARRLGRAPSAGEVYAAHVLGAGGAARLIAAAEEGAPSAAALFPREAGANRWLFWGRDGQERSAQALLARFDIQAGEGRPDTSPGLGAVSVQLASFEPSAPSAALGLRGRSSFDGPARRIELADVGADGPMLDQQRAAERASAMIMVELLIDSTRSRALSMLASPDMSDPAGGNGARGLELYRRMAS
jgi:hypothetical protein